MTATPPLHAVTDLEAARLALRAQALTAFKARYRHNAESQRAMVGALRRLATGFTDGACDETTFPWEVIVDADLSEQVWGAVAERYAVKTATKDASALRVMLACCRRVGLLTYEEYRHATTFEAKGGQPRPPAGRYLSEPDVGRIILSTARGRGGDATRLRDTALLLATASSGARTHEITGAQLHHTHLDEARIWLERTKGDRQRNAWLHPAAVEAVRAWLELRGGQPGPLFVPLSRTGRPMLEHGELSTHQARKVIRARAREAGFDGVSAHDLRRFVISTLLETTDLALVAKVVGHKNPVTTAGYDRRPLARQRAAVATLSLPSLAPAAALRPTATPHNVASG